MVSKDVHILIPGICDMYVTWQRGIKVADGIEVASQLTWTQGGDPGFSRWA